MSSDRNAIKSELIKRMSRIRYAYLHGFASSPLASKAVHLRAWFEKELNSSLHIPNLNIPSFRKQTLTRIINHVEQMLLNSDTGWLLIGSSFGGLASTLVAHRRPEPIHSIVLLAPAFDATRIWKSTMDIAKWKTQGYLNHYNVSTNTEEPVDYAFFQDLQSHPAYPVVKNCPISIVHGIHDDVVPIENSREYVRRAQKLTKSSIKLLELEDDHHLRTDKTLKIIKDVIQEGANFSSR